MAKFTQVRADTFGDIQINAGILLSDFDTTDGGSYDDEDIIGATTGGNTFNSNPEFSDYGEDIDNVPNNTMQMKRITSYNPVLSGTFVVMNTRLGKMLVAAADIDSSDTTHIIPRNSLDVKDFNDIWLVGDYSTNNSKENGGYVAIHIKNALSTGGFQWSTTKDGKGQFSYEFTGHYSMEDIDDVPFEIYIKDGKEEDIE